MDATNARFATISRAFIVILAIYWCTTNALTVDTHLPLQTMVTIKTLAMVWWVRADPIAAEV
jgi:hypothetical protein